MLWRSLWKIHVATVRRTKAPLCNTSVSQNRPHPCSKRNHCCYCAGLTTGRDEETKQRRKPSRAARLCETSPCVYCPAAGCWFFIWKLPQSHEDSWTRSLISSTRFRVRHDGTYKTSVKSERGILRNWGETHQKIVQGCEFVFTNPILTPNLLSFTDHAVSPMNKNEEGLFKLTIDSH